MPELILVGTGNALAAPGHENTHIALKRSQGVILVDSAASPKVRLDEASLELNQITDLILTHFHPDHVSGVPLLLMSMWLLGRSESLRIHGLQHCLDRVEQMMGLYRWQSWPHFFPVAFRWLPEREDFLVFEDQEVRIVASPVRHLIPTIGLRFEGLQSGRTVVYSCDTEPCSSLARLAAGADILLHEASGAGQGHSSASQAGSIAREAGVKKLLLIHYPAGERGSRTLIEQARETFSGEVGLAVDFMTIAL